MHTLRPPPAYELADFLAACGVSGRVVVMSTALDTASHWGLRRDKNAVLNWIASGGVENARFVKSDPWRNNPKPTPVMVDIYDFYSGPAYGYLAFMHQPSNGLWLLKSLKKNDRPDPREAWGISFIPKRGDK